MGAGGYVCVQLLKWRWLLCEHGSTKRVHIAFPGASKKAEKQAFMGSCMACHDARMCSRLYPCSTGCRVPRSMPEIAEVAAALHGVPVSEPALHRAVSLDTETGVSGRSYHLHMACPVLGQTWAQVFSINHPFQCWNRHSKIQPYGELFATAFKSSTAGESNRAQPF